ncbi:SURF1 family cytochrome oxidase biogenesis protein [Haloechinothrix sp. LS1_15]|uniref:SURF1 family cytochrome oxidase biogenesis protein n=1 Tax=Haloechinothrix sp. LS1_15 TaxID=2652248 RepID=UPI002948ABC3|nr:SURF1 family cytochrome oxidase biogenesis protein [Haloechinothrix sp. LS1_15]MDV6013829.1 SURF1 family protein [Haloechinothrix sp. LS1_15]
MRWKLLLRPRWLALTALVFVFAAACFTMLGPWQFDRHESRSAQNEAVQESLEAEPSPLDETLPDGTAPDERTQWSRVTIAGEYLPEDEVLARLRTVQGEPAYEVLTPMRTTGGERVLINRGYVRPEQGSVPRYDPPPDGEVTVIARARVDEPPPGDREAIDRAGSGQIEVYNVSSATVGEATGLDLRPGYFQLDNDQPGEVNALPLPRTTAGPFFSYALQWYAFGVMALVAWLYFTLRELRPGGALRDGSGRAGSGGSDGFTGTRRKRKSVAELLAEDEEQDSGSAAGAGHAAPQPERAARN